MNLIMRKCHRHALYLPLTRPAVLLMEKRRPNARERQKLNLVQTVHVVHGHFGLREHPVSFSRGQYSYYPI